MKRLGLIGGISHKSTIDYYDGICQLHFTTFRNHAYPEIVINSLNFQKLTKLENEGDREKYIDYLVDACLLLENANVDVIAISANSPHTVIDELSDMIKTPIISIIDEAVSYILGLTISLKKTLILGIPYTMNSKMYDIALSQIGVQTIIPYPSDQKIIERIIFEELSNGIILNESRKELLALIQSYQVDSVILGCTELPLILSQDHINIKVINPSSIHLEAIYKMLTSKEMK